MVIFLIVMLLFGAKKIPEMARSFGKAAGEFKSAKRELEKEMQAAEREAEAEAAAASEA